MKNAFVFLICLLGLSMSACNNGSTNTVIISGGGTNPVTTATSDVKKIVAVGAGINFNNITGGQVEMALNPTTHTPSILYYDKTQQIVPGAPAGALKFASMDALGN